MRMQEPEQWQQSDQEWQTSQDYSKERADYPGWYESERSQKIHSQEEQWQGNAPLGTYAIILAIMGFFFALIGIVASALVLAYGNGQQIVLAGGIVGLLSSIMVMLSCIAYFATAVILEPLRARRGRPRM